MKITPKPLVHSDKINKARDMSGLHKWSRESKLVGYIMFFLGWFTIPSEVILRRTFGRRWFTPLNFYAGAFLLFWVFSIQYFMDARESMASYESIFGSFYSVIFHLLRLKSPVRLSFYWGSIDMLVFVWLYIVLGLKQLFKIWWRDRTGIEVHSYDDGTSLLEPVGVYLAKIINALGARVFSGYIRKLPEEERQSITGPPKLIEDPATFTDTILEPWLITWAGMNIAYTAERYLFFNKETDLKDSALEARAMAEVRTRKKDVLPLIVTNKKEIKRDNDSPLPMHSHTVSYPDLKTIIEEMHKEGSHLGN